MSQNICFAVLEEIHNKVVTHWSAVLISCNHSITSLSLLQKTLQIRDKFFLYMDPVLAEANMGRMKWDEEENRKKEWGKIKCIKKDVELKDAALYQALKYVFPETQLRHLPAKFCFYVSSKKIQIDERSYENLF
jgi:hypothetical protein